MAWEPPTLWALTCSGRSGIKAVMAIKRPLIILHAHPAASRRYLMSLVVTHAQSAYAELLT